jgi:hypothetical protein
MMKEIKLTPNENPRWTMFRAAIGREPEVWEFVIWSGRRWRDYAEHLGLRKHSSDAVFVDCWGKDMSTEEIQAAFGAWLKAAVEAGKYCGVDL